MFFITLAHAEGAAAAPSQFLSFLPLVLVFGVFYFLLIRPQQKRAKEHQGMLENLKVKTVVVAAGGIIGKITKIQEKTVDIEIAPKIEITILKSAITDLAPDGIASAK